MRAVTLGPGLPSPVLEALAARAETVAPDLDGAVELALELGKVAPSPASGRTVELWETLATVGAADLTVARVAEPHLDALHILEEAELAELPLGGAQGGLWGVYAAESPGGAPANVRAVRDPEGRWEVSGRKPWCSLAGRADRALVTAWIDDEARSLFAIDLSDAGVSATDVGQAAWASRGLAAVRSTPIDLDSVSALPVGGPGWYLERGGFAWGGIGVAAIWFGAAVALARTLREATSRRPPDQVALMHLGAVDAALARARAVLVVAAAAADDPAPGGTRDDLARLALRTRQTVADAAAEVLDRVGRALGPQPLTQDETHARRAADLVVYLRQHHAERDQARLGGLVPLDGDRPAVAGDWRWW